MEEIATNWLIECGASQVLLSATQYSRLDDANCCALQEELRVIGGRLVFGKEDNLELIVQSYKIPQSCQLP